MAGENKSFDIPNGIVGVIGILAPLIMEGIKEFSKFAAEARKKNDSHELKEKEKHQKEEDEKRKQIEKKIKDLREKLSFEIEYISKALEIVNYVIISDNVVLPPEENYFVSIIDTFIASIDMDVWNYNIEKKENLRRQLLLIKDHQVNINEIQKFTINNHVGNKFYEFAVIGASSDGLYNRKERSCLIELKSKFNIDDNIALSLEKKYLTKKHIFTTKLKNN